jgi:hypothetical protein
MPGFENMLRFIGDTAEHKLVLLRVADERHSLIAQVLQRRAHI